jgi:hypothetical protein
VAETSLAASFTTARAEPVVRPGAFGEFVLLGGATLLALPLSWFARRWFGLDAAELAVGFTAFYGAHLINDPHFAVTYLLFYRDVRRRAFGDAFAPAQRLRYLLAGFAAPLLLLAWSVLAIAAGSPSMLGQLMEAMFFLVGWHYVKQGFGMLNVVSARHGVRYSASERRVLLAHCFSAWAFAWAHPSLSAIDVEEKGVVYRALPHPALLEGLAGAVLVASSLALAVTLFRKWRREGRLSLYPLTAFLVTIWLWTIFTSVDPLLVYVIPALHSVQYLYFVWLLRRNQASAAEVEFGPPVRERLLLLAVGALALGALQFHLLPDLLDSARLLIPKHAPLDLGATPWFAALFAFVNIHHYLMDAVIWRRENPETSYLYR